jgi:RimJ/RimL family protein N-acetyltransferase
LACEDVFKLNLQKIYLYADRDYSPSNALYLKIGFKKIDENIEMVFI